MIYFTLFSIAAESLIAGDLQLFLKCKSLHFDDEDDDDNDDVGDDNEGPKTQSFNIGLYQVGLLCWKL